MAKDIRVVLELDNRQYNNAIKQSQTRTKQFTNDTKSGLSGLKTAFAGLFAAIGVREIVNLSDEFSNLRNRLVAVTGSQEDAASALDLVNQVAAQSRSDIGSVASLFADLTVATKDLGTSQKEIADVTRVFSQTLQISGADAGAAAGAIRQFGQALASGVLRGDEFNSIAETNSFFMLQFADSLGVPIGKLRDLAKEGKLTADLILQATRDMKDRVDEAFSETATTVSQAFTSLRNSVVNLFGEIEGETGVFTGLATAIQNLADSINSIDVQKLVGEFDNLIYVAGILIATLGFRGLLGVLNKLQKGFIGIGLSLGLTSGAMVNAGRATASFKGLLRGLLGVVSLGFLGGNKGGVFGALGAAISNFGRIALRFVVGPAGALLFGLEGLSFISKKLGGPDFMKGPRDKIIDFGKDLLGFNDTVEETNQDLEDLLNIGDGDGGDAGGDGVLKLDDRLQKFKDSLDDLKVTTPEYQRMLAHLNATFSKETVADLRLYNQALSALNQAFPEQAEEIRNLQKEAERLAEKKEELRLLEQQGRTAIELFNSSLLKQFYTTEELEEKQGELNALLSKYPELANLVADAQDRLDQAFSENEGINSFLNTLSTAQKTLSEDLANALLEGEKPLEAFKNFFKKIVQQILADIIRLSIIQPILGSILAPFGLGFGTGGSIVRKEVGGPVMANRPYIVGERGPEMFVPNTAGSIMRNDQLGMGGAVTYNINAVDARSFQQLVASDPEFIFSVTEAGRRRIPGRF